MKFLLAAVVTFIVTFSLVIFGVTNTFSQEAKALVGLVLILSFIGSVVAAFWKL